MKGAQTIVPVAPTARRGIRLGGSAHVPRWQSFDLIAEMIKRAARGDADAQRFIADPVVARNIRNRPRLRALLEGRS